MALRTEAFSEAGRKIGGLFTTGTVLSDCDANYGPAGSPVCVLLEPDYHKYQWSKCLTDAYIKHVKLASKVHQCKDQSRVYCYYQCMNEIHDDGGSGPVFDDCACGRDASANVSTPTPLSTLDIAEWCFSPNDTQCNWYTECIQKRYPCTGQQSPYSPDFSKKFCDLYTKNYHFFDDIGQRWINAVRKCLQIELVPALRPFIHKSCEDIKKLALDSHTECYTKPGDNKPSLCDIGARDMFLAFWTLRGTLDQSSSNALCQMLSISRDCSWNNTLLDLGMAILELRFGARSNLTVGDIRIITDTIAKSRQWHDRGFTHFEYTNAGSQEMDGCGENFNKTDAQFIKIILAPEAEYNLNAQNGTVTPANVTREALNTAKALANKELKVDTPVALSPVMLKFVAMIHAPSLYSVFNFLRTAHRKLVFL